MLLNFTVKYPKHVTDKAGQPTYFVEQIMRNPRRKIHTLREKAARFKPGCKLHICTGSRTPAYLLHGIEKFHSFETVDISASRLMPHHTDTNWHLDSVVVDGRNLSTSMIETFWKNDGFYSEKDFCEWFFASAPKNAKYWTIERYIIHFTDFRYVTGAV